MGAPFDSPEFCSAIGKLRANNKRVLLTCSEAIALLEVCTQHVDLVEELDWAGHH